MGHLSNVIIIIIIYIKVLPPEFSKKKEPVALERAWRRRKRVYRFGEKDDEDGDEDGEDGMDVEQEESVEGTEYQDGSDGEYSGGEDIPAA